MTVVSRKSIQNETKEPLKYWHELIQEEIDKIIKSGRTVEQVLKEFSQPDWCAYPDAISGMIGCWSLMEDNIRQKISKEFCKNCDAFKSKTKK